MSYDYADEVTHASANEQTEFLRVGGPFPEMCKWNGFAIDTSQAVLRAWALFLREKFFPRLRAR